MNKAIDMKRGSTVFLRLAAGVISLGVLALCAFLLPELWVYAYDEFPTTGGAVRVIVAAMYLAAVPFFIGVYKGWTVLDAVDKEKIFSKKPINALRVIAYCAALISAIYIVSLPFFYAWQDSVDAPGLMVIGMFLVGTPLIVSVAIALLRRLLVEATTIKSENDLTV